MIRSIRSNHRPNLKGGRLERSFSAVSCGIEATLFQLFQPISYKFIYKWKGVPMGRCQFLPAFAGCSTRLERLERVTRALGINAFSGSKTAEEVGTLHARGWNA